MRRFIFLIGLFLISFYCFSQQNLPSKIIGKIPDNESIHTYQIQVGAFKIVQNANYASLILKSRGFYPIFESYSDLTRVILPNIPAWQVKNYLMRIKSLGFNEVIIRENKNDALNMPRKKELTKDIENLIPPKIMEAIEDLGIEINEGRNPPNIEGTFYISTLQLVKSTTGGGIAKQWDKYVTFSKQNNTTLTINADYTMTDEHDNGPFNSEGPGSFIVGQGKKFTVVVDGTRKQGGYTAKTVEIFSGELSDTGIINYHWAVMMIENNGNPLGSWIQNGTGYTKRDSDGFSERIK